MSLTDTRTAMIEIGIDTRSMDTGVRDAKRKLLGMVDVKGLGRKIAIGGMVGNLASAGFGKLTDLLSDVGGEILSFERNMTRLQIAGGRTAGGMMSLRGAISQVSRETSVSREQLLEGTSAYVRMTGDLAGAEVALSTFGKVAIATGADMKDITMTAAALQKNLKIDPKDFKTAFDIMITQGKAGAIELDELSTLISGIAPTFASFAGGSGLKGMQQMTAALQVGRSAFGTSAETATGLRNFATSLKKNAKKFKGIRVVEKDAQGVEQLRDMRSLVIDIGNSKLAQSDGMLLKAFGGIEEFRFFKQLFGNLKDYDKLLQGMGDNATDKDSAAYLASDVGKLETAVNAAKLAIVDAFTPERITAFISALSKMAEVFAKIVGYVEYLANNRMTKQELADEKLTVRQETAATRKRKLMVEKYGHLFGPASAHPGRASPGDEMRTRALKEPGRGGVAAMMQRGIYKPDPKLQAGWNTAEMELWNLMSEEQRAEFRAASARENLVRERLGQGATAKDIAPLAAGLSFDQLLGMSGEIRQASDAKALATMQANEIAKQMAAAMKLELDRLKIVIANSPDATATFMENAPGNRTTVTQGR
jgi:hypothetical protein